MRTGRWGAIAAVAAVAGLAAAAPRGGGVERLAWMAGCWEGGRPGRAYEEVWSAPRGGVMLGMSRTTRGDAYAAHEFLRIHPHGEGMAYTAQPHNQPQHTFPATEVGDASVVFADPAHDFPQRILYRRAGDSLIARVEGPGPGGTTRGFDYRMAKVACP
jgi:hypothetical protein